MPELKRTFLKGRMNKDLDERLLPSGEYRDAVNIQVSTSEGSDVGAIETIIGNTVQGKRTDDENWETATGSPFGLTNPKCIGVTRDTQNNKIYWFVAADGGKSVIFEYDEATAFVAVVIADLRTGDDQVLSFNAKNLITGINIIDGMLFWTDNLNEPRKINISTFKASPTNKTGNQVNETTTLYSAKTDNYIAFTATDVNVIKKSPKKAPEMELYSSLIGNGELKGTGITPLITEPANFSALNSESSAFGEPDYSNKTLNFGQNIAGASLFLGKNVKLSAITEDKEGNKEKYELRGHISAFTVNSLTFNPLVVPGNIIDKALNWELLIDESDFIYKREFPRFCYRWKYEDGEYSALSPFTEPAFIPGVYDYQGMDAENRAMLNHLRRIQLKFPERLTTYGPPRGVEYVEVLYKTGLSNNIYIVKTVKLKKQELQLDPSGPSSGSGLTGQGPATGNSGGTDPSTDTSLNSGGTFIVIDGDFREFNITEELDGPVIESNQLLRLFDNVPKRAQAQEIIANRIVYGNYTENYDENTDPVVIQTGLAGITSFTPGDSTEQQVLLGAPSVKSDKTYQLGVSFLDDFNRESPVFTNDSANVRVKKDRSLLSNAFMASVKSSAPSWAKFFKYYVKDNYSEEYNLLLDRYYDGGDGNYWLSFPSAERNKITEKDIIVLKKQHGTTKPVVYDNEYKVVDIKNDPPEALRLNNLTPIARNEVHPAANATTIYNNTNNDIVFHGPARAINEQFHNKANSALAIQFENPNISGTVTRGKTKIYKLESGGRSDDANTGDDCEYTFVLKEPLTAADKALLSAVDTQNSDFVNVILYGPDEFLSMEYQGRFFVKIEKRANFENDIIKSSRFAEGSTYIKKATPKNIIAGVTGYDFTDSRIIPGFKQSLTGGVNIDIKRWNWQGLSYTNVDTALAARIGFDHTDAAFPTQLLPGNGTNAKTFYLVYGPIDAEIDTVKDVYYGAEVGQKIRFTDGELKSSKFLITAVDASANYTATNGKVFAYKEVTIDRDYNPSDEIAVNDIDGIEIVAENPSIPLTDNPAVFEIKPEKNIDLDIYYEASGAFPIAELADEKKLGYSNCIAFGNGVESTRIADDFNKPSYGKGVRASSILKKPYKEETRSSGMIFSGIVNSRTDINNSNQFIVAENITKDINPIHGSIQKLHARDNDLIALCEDKCFRILADKDALFNANGDVNLTASNKVLGQVMPFAGEFGISKNPESFVSYGFRAYFTDKSRGAVLRLSADGLTEISEQGMSDYFEDALKGSNAIRGSYDESAGTYNLKIGSNHASYDEGNRGWCTTLSYDPDFAISLNNTYYSFKNSVLWKHTETANRANFYASQDSSSVTVIFNDAPSSIKNFKTIFYEGDAGWTVDLETDRQTGVTNVGLNPNLAGSISNKFFEREGKYYNFIGGDALSWNNSTQAGNLDTAEFSTQGIGNVTSYTNGSTATIQFAAALSLPNSLQIGDNFFYVSTTDSNIYRLGDVASITDSSTETTLTITKVTSGVPSNLPVAGDFAFFVKDPRANTSGILGYFNKATFTNTGTGKNELFAVGTEMFISS